MNPRTPMSEFNWIAVDSVGQNVVLTVNGSRAELLRRLADDFPPGRYDVMRVEAVETFAVRTAKIVEPVK
jgi:hypothetical protein